MRQVGSGVGGLIKAASLGSGSLWRRWCGGASSCASLVQNALPVHEAGMVHVLSSRTLLAPCHREYLSFPGRRKHPCRTLPHRRSLRHVARWLSRWLLVIVRPHLPRRSSCSIRWLRRPTIPVNILLGFFIRRQKERRRSSIHTPPSIALRFKTRSSRSGK